MPGQPKRLGPHFVLAEFTSGDGARVPSWKVACYRSLVRDVLEPLRSEFGSCSVNSGFRSVAHNHQVGGAGDSYHLARRGRAGCAADVSFARGTPKQWYEAADRLGVDGLGLYATHIHVDNRGYRARW